MIPLTEVSTCGIYKTKYSKFQKQSKQRNELDLMEKHQTLTGETKLSLLHYQKLPLPQH